MKLKEPSQWTCIVKVYDIVIASCLIFVLCRSCIYFALFSFWKIFRRSLFLIFLRDGFVPNFFDKGALVRFSLIALPSSYLSFCKFLNLRVYFRQYEVAILLISAFTV
jgi:hypothetical protein